MIGKTLAHYEILRSLGHGGMGEVYLARDTKLGREVALKLLPEKLRADADRRARFEREAQAIAALNHPHVVTLYAVEEADDLPFLVMEFVDGRTLGEEVGTDGLSMDRFFDLAGALTEAVAAAHAKGITHRDLKPHNVMIDREGRLKVLDFGLAKLLEETAEPEGEETIAADPALTREGTIVGTAAYMSPEQAEGKPVDSRSDVFSLGILLYQMITGQQPFKGDTQMSTLTAVLRDDPLPVMEIRPELPRQLARIIRRCLEKDPERRYESARGIHYDLRILSEEIDSGVHEKPEYPTARPVSGPGSQNQGRRVLPWLAGVFAVAVIAVGSVWLGTRDNEASTAVATGVEPSAAVAKPTIVVFPFENQGPPEDAYFAAGITDEIVTSLTGVDGLRVLSRTSSQHYDRVGKSMQQIAADLGVDYVLEGSVRWERAADEASRVRVTPQLMNAATDEQIWAERYDRSMAEIFAVQSEIAGEVVRSLGVTLAMTTQAPAVEAPTDDMTAYHAYLRGMEINTMSRFDATSWNLAIDMLEKAVARDPAFHEAWVALTKANSGLCHFGWDRTEERLARAKAAFDRAHHLKPNSSLTHYARGIYYYWGLKDYDRALTAFREAQRLRPEDPDVLESTAYVLRRQESYDEAIGFLRQAADLSPQNPALSMHIAETLSIVENYDQALALSDEAVELGPDQAMNYTQGAWIGVQAGRPEEAVRFLAEIPPHTDAEIDLQLFRIYVELRDYAAALRHAAVLPDIIEAQYLATSRHLATGLAHQAMDRPELAREDFTRAEALIAVKVAEKPDAGSLRAAHAIALAGMGRSEEALAAVQLSLDLFPASKDPWIATWRMWDLAYVQMLCGQAEDAVRTLESLMSRQTDIISPAILRNSPYFDELRGREDFQRLLSDQS